jgi:hypothetical protein
MRFLDQFTWTREQMQKLKCQTWMLLGSLSKPRLGDAESWVAALVDLIPGMTLYPLKGQGHVAYLSDPVLLTMGVASASGDGIPSFVTILATRAAGGDSPSRAGRVPTKTLREDILNAGDDGLRPIRKFGPQ